MQRVQLRERQKMPKMMKSYSDSDHEGDSEQELLHGGSITKKFRAVTDDEAGELRLQGFS